MPLRQLDRNELYDVNGMALEHRNEQLRNDLDSFYAGARNAALSGAASIAGTVGDFESLVKTLMQAKKGYILPNKTVAPTSDDIAGKIGADLNTPSGWIGQIGVPDWGDVAKLGVLGVAKTGKLLRHTADYYGTPGARGLSHRVKLGDPDAVRQMASEMAENIPSTAILVPVPSSAGVATETKLLAKEIARIRGNKVEDVLSGDNRKSWYRMKKEGATEQPDFNIKSKRKINGDVILIDTVEDTGGTIRQSRQAIPGADYRVYAKVLK